MLANSIRKEAKKKIVHQKANNNFKLVKLMKNSGIDIEGEKYMKGISRKLDFIEKDRKRI